MLKHRKKPKMEPVNLTIECIEPFQQWLYEKGRSENTAKSYSSDVRVFFLESSITSIPVSELPPTVALWMNKNKRVVSATTSRRRLASMRELGAWSGIKPFLPDFKLPTPGQPIPHPLPGLGNDLESMLGHCKNEIQQCLIALLGLEGLRLSEALCLEFSDFDIKEMTIKIWGKGDKERVIPITMKAWPYIYPRLIKVLLERSRKIIPYSDRGARYFITELGCRAGVARSVASHDLRATFATLAYATKKDIRAVQAWLGHKDVSTTQLYVQTSLDTMRSVGEF